MNTASFLSRDLKMSLKTFSNAVSVLCRRLYADCRSSHSLCVQLCDLWADFRRHVQQFWRDTVDWKLAYNFSIHMEETAFFIRGRIIVVLKELGIWPSVIERFTMRVITGKSSSRHCFEQESRNGIQLTRGCIRFRYYFLYFSLRKWFKTSKQNRLITDIPIKLERRVNVIIEQFLNFINFSFKEVIEIVC